MESRTIAVAAVMASVSCAGTPPSAMSAAEHEATAASLELEARDYENRYYSRENLDINRCVDQNRGPICWSMFRNPTAADEREAARHRALAAQHRAASKALRDAEARACAGLSADDRDLSPFLQRADILTVEPIQDDSEIFDDLQGAAVTFRAVPGLTADWLQRVVDCDVARNAALGVDRPEAAQNPLAVAGVHATVSTTQKGLTVAITSDDEATARTILQRARRLGI